MTERNEILPGMQHLRVNLRAWLASGQTTIIITSGDPEDGKTILASGLAITLAQSGLRVLLMDVNFVHPSLHEVFNVDNSYGVTDYLTMSDPGELPRMMHHVKENLQVIPAGTAKPFAGLLETPRCKQLIQYLQSSYDVVIMDTPAASDSADVFALLDRTVNLLVVVRLRHTYRESLKLLSGQLRHQETAAAGLVFVGVTEQAIVSAIANQSLTEEVVATTHAAEQPFTRW
jgi:Mrp family chromosome partitioning ATPase